MAKIAHCTCLITPQVMRMTPATAIRNVSYEIDFRANVGHNVTVVIWSEYENYYEIDKFGGILYSINS